MAKKLYLIATWIPYEGPCIHAVATSLAGVSKWKKDNPDLSGSRDLCVHELEGKRGLYLFDNNF